MTIFEKTLAFGSCFSDYASMWIVILAIVGGLYFLVFWLGRGRGSGRQKAYLHWGFRGALALLVVVAVGFAFHERQTVRVATINKDIDIVGCVGIYGETSRTPLSQVRFEHASHRQSGQKSSRIVHEFFVRPLGATSRDWLARFRADSDGVNWPALRKLAPEAVAAYEAAIKRLAPER